MLKEELIKIKKINKKLSKNYHFIYVMHIQEKEELQNNTKHYKRNGNFLIIKLLQIARGLLKKPLCQDQIIIENEIK